MLSLLFATIPLLLLLREKQYAAATLLAVFPPSVLFAADGRSYALCAMFVAIGILARNRYAAALSFVLAAYSHYYGVLFFPLVRNRAALLYVLFLPGLWLALHQPREAMRWMSRFNYPDALFARPPLLLVILLIAALATVAFEVRSSKFEVRSSNWLLPYVLSLPIYVPLRFESVVAFPLMQWLGSAKRWFLVAACFATWTVIGIVDHATRPPDDYREAALRVRDARERVVASGYLYLYTVLQRPVTAFPREQAEHPGWRATATSGSELPSGTFLWIGERAAPELAIIRQQRVVEPVYVNAHAIIVRVR